MRNQQPKGRSLNRFELIVRYGFFAIIATVANLGSQRLMFAIAPSEYSLGLALFFGTGVGLVVKYLLDKRWIFHQVPQAATQETRTFTLYTLTGVATTALFWGMESGAWMIWQSDQAREIGAIVGLGIGYVVKYNLDKRFVFSSAKSAG